MIAKAAVMVFTFFHWALGIKNAVGRQFVSKMSASSFGRLPRSYRLSYLLSPPTSTSLHLRHRPLRRHRGGIQSNCSSTKPADLESQLGTKPKVVVVAGPTAVGKSALAEELCRRLNGEIISADSVQVYRRLNIGSAKPTAEIQKDIRHHLVDTRNPEEEYNAAMFAEDAHKAISNVVSRGKVPIVVGGTNFYIEWLLYGKPDAPPPTEEASIRAQSEVEAFGGDWNRALQRLQEVDPATTEKMPANNWYRMQRALEVFYTEGKPLSEYLRPYGKNMNKEEFLEFIRANKYDYRCYFVSRDRVELFRSIDRRCEIMVQNGLLQEVAELVKNGDLIVQREIIENVTPAERAIGYRQSLDFLANCTRIVSESSTPEHAMEIMDESFQEFLKVFMAVSRQFAQRQIKSFRREPMVNWVRWSPKLVDRMGYEIDLPSEEFWNVRCGTGPEFSDDLPSSSDVEFGDPIRFPTEADQKRLVRETKEYQSKIVLFNDSESRRSVLIKLMQSLQ